MCLLPDSHILDGMPYTENVVYPPFIDAAHETSTSPPPPLRPHWDIQHEIGDGACGFRAIARRFLHSPDLHLQVRQLIVTHLADHRDVHDYHINDGIGKELLLSMHFHPSVYTSYDDYLQKMSMPTTFVCGSAGDPGGHANFRPRKIHVHLSTDTLPDPSHADDTHLDIKFNANSKHYDTFVLVNQT